VQRSITPQLDVLPPVGQISNRVLTSSTLALGRIPVKVGFCLTSQVSGSARKLDAYIAIAQLLGADEKLVCELKAFAGRTTKLAGQRNRVVHDPWLVPTAKGVSQRLEITARKKLRHEYIAVSASEINAHFRY
jgi:hypothetical protein